MPFNYYSDSTNIVPNLETGFGSPCLPSSEPKLPDDKWGHYRQPESFGSPSSFSEYLPSSSSATPFNSPYVPRDFNKFCDFALRGGTPSGDHSQFPATSEQDTLGPVEPLIRRYPSTSFDPGTIRSPSMDTSHAQDMHCQGVPGDLNQHLTDPWTFSLPQDDIELLDYLSSLLGLDFDEYIPPASTTGEASAGSAASAGDCGVTEFPILPNTFPPQLAQPHEDRSSSPDPLDARNYKDRRVFVLVKLHYDVFKSHLPFVKTCEERFNPIVGSAKTVTSALRRRKDKTARPRWVCDVCPVDHLRNFTRKANLKNHIYSHFEIKQHRCDRCKAKFPTKTSLTRHENKYCGGPSNLSTA